MICSKRKYAKNIKAKRSKYFLYGCKRVSWKCESYMIYLNGDSSHQTVMIMCECIRCSHISNCHNLRNLCTLVMFSNTTRIFFATLDTCVGIMCFGHHKGYMC